MNVKGVLCLLMICSAASLVAAELAETPWPMFHHYPNHTGTSPHYGPNNSSVAWTFSTGDNIFGSAAVGDDGTIYVGTRGQQPVTGSRLYAIHPNGTERWHWRPSHYIDSTSAIADDGTLYVGSWDKRLYAINPDGTMKWEFSADGGFVYTSPAIGSDGTIYIGNNDGRVYAVHPDGTKKWSYQTLRAVQSSPAIAADGTIYVGSNDRKLYAINPDGTKKWSYTTGNRVMSSPAIGTDGTIYVGSDDGRLYASHPNGALKWTYATGYWVRSSPAIDSNGTIYVGSGDKKLYALYQNGTLKWSYATGGMIWSSPAIDADGTIYVGAKNGYVYAINPNGTLLWTCDTGGRIYAPSPTIDADGMIYTGNEDGDFYAIGPGIQPNRPPVLDPIGDKLINETETLVIALSATDPNEDVFNCSCNRTDLFADFDPVAGTGSWTPGHEDSGIYLVEFNVSDGRGGTDNETITIEVLNVNRPPLLDSIGNKVLNETETLVISLNGSDPDGDTITYSCNRTDLFTDFDLAAGIGSWTPGYEDSGMYWIEFGVSDSNRAATNETITIEVLNVDRPPVLDPVGNKVLNETETLLIYLNGSDPDGDPLTYSASNLPAGAVFNSTTQTFSWTPGFDQAGTYPDVCLEVDDGELADPENVTITVTNVPPLISVISKPEVVFQEQFTVNITVDPRMTEIYGVEYDLSFDNTVLHAEWQNEGMLLNHDGAYTTVYINTIDNDCGKVSFASTRLGTPDGVTDPGTFAKVRFTAIEPGACTNLNLTYVIASDPEADPVPPMETNNTTVCVSPNIPPAAAGKSIHRYNNEGEKYICKAHFNGTESYDPDGEVVYWRWSFGDGNYGTGEFADHEYQSWIWNGSGYDSFEVILTVTDNGDPHQHDDSTSFEVVVYTAGDANGDGRVNILDATIVGLEWGETAICGDYCWEGNERADRADLNNDCKVNILDAVIMGTCWGHTAW